MVTTYFIDNDYLDLFKMRIISGRNFSLNQSTDPKDEVIINETLARMLGMVDPVGNKISKWGREIEVIGLVEDFNFTSMKSRIEPLIFSYYPERSNIALIRLSGNNFESSLSYIEFVFGKFDANFALDYSFMDDEYNNLYVDESVMGKVILSFSIISCLIAIIGIYGLVAFVVSGMTKNIGVRKAMGASVLSATCEILRKFLLPVSLAAIIFLPLAWYISFNWLKDFSYRSSLGAGQLIFSVLIVALASFFAIIHKTLKAAYVNPADSLRYS
jgi:putative ABC transport system permease protein